jgi:hypothetical protein
LELSDDLQIARPACRPFDFDQPSQAQTAACDAEQLELDGIVLEILVATATRDLPEEIERAQIRGQCEVEATVNRPGIEAEGKPRRGASQVGMIGFREAKSVIVWRVGQPVGARLQTAATP